MIKTLLEHSSTRITAAMIAIIGIDLALLSGACSVMPSVLHTFSLGAVFVLPNFVSDCLIAIGTLLCLIALIIDVVSHGRISGRIILSALLFSLAITIPVALSAIVLHYGKCSAINLVGFVKGITFLFFPTAFSIYNIIVANAIRGRNGVE